MKELKTEAMWDKTQVVKRNKGWWMNGSWESWKGDRRKTSTRRLNATISQV